MPVSSGPNTVNDSIVFTYDIGDVANSYKGEPTTNLITDPDGNANVITNDVPLNTNIIGYASYNSGYYVNPRTTTSTSATGKTFTYSVYMRSRTSPASTYLMYVYTGTGPDGGWWYFGDGSLTTDWKRYTYTRSDLTGTVTTVTVYRYNQQGTIEIAAPQFEEKTYATSFVKGTRSTTTGLLDISGNSNTINLVNMTYGANNLITFDGTDDYTDVTSNLGTLSQYTIEHVSYKGSENRMPIAFRGGPVFYQYGDNSWYYTHSGVAGEYYYPKTKTINGWGHWVIAYNGFSVKIYRNGVYEGQQTTTGTADWTNGMRIGYWPYGGGYAWNGQIAIVKMYNRALSDTEVTNNYLAYKTRFNLS